MCLHSVLNLSPVERVRKWRFSNTNKNQNRVKIALGKNTILLGFGYSTLTFMSKRAPRGVVRGRSRGGLRWMGWRTWRSFGFVARWSPMVPERVHL